MTCSDEPNRARAGDPHGWNSLENYLEVHRSYLDDLREYFVEGDDLSYDPLTLEFYEIRGRVHCRHGLFVDIDKRLARNARGQVRTIKYSYHAGIEGRQDRPIFRYDNAHCHEYAGHTDEHHKHNYDYSTWQEIEPPEWVGYEGWPHLNEVILELEAWWQATGQYLDLSEVLEGTQSGTE